MKVNELIEQLEAVKKEHGNLPVYVWADHGQMGLSVGSATFSFIDEDGEPIHEDDAAEYGEDELTKGIVIDG